jgi:hypothetical protein
MRDAAVERLKKMSDVDVLPPLVRERASRERLGISRYWGMAPSKEGASPEVLAELAILELWHAHTYANYSPQRGRALLAIIKDWPGGPLLGMVIREMEWNWVDEAEDVLGPILRDRWADEHARTQAAGVLLEHRYEKYYPQVRTIMVSSPLGMKDTLFRSLIESNPVRQHEYYERQRTVPIPDPVLITAGFDLMEQWVESSGRVQSGYHTALFLGEILDQEFKPDQNLPQYKGEHGLKDEFFETPVRRARAWWAQNGVATRQKAQQIESGQLKFMPPVR